MTLPLPPPPGSWTAEIDPRDSPDAAGRRAIAERLGVLGGAWSVAVLERALHDEHDASVRETVWRALLRLRSV